VSLPVPVFIQTTDVHTTTMSNQDDDAADLKPTFAEGFKLGEKKSVDQYAKLDAEDESLAKWKANLGVTASAAGSGSGPQVSVLTLFLTSPSLNGRNVELDLTDQAKVEATKKSPILIKEGVEYNVGIRFKVHYDVISGLRYIHIVKRAGVKVDKMEQMIGSFGPSKDGEPYTSNFPPEESPSGLLARSGSYSVKSRVVDDDGQVFADFEWTFKLAKEW